MAITQEIRKYWVTNDGSYGYGAVMSFDEGDLSVRQQEVYDNLGDEDKFVYLQAVMNGDVTDKWEATNE